MWQREMRSCGATDMEDMKRYHHDCREYCVKLGGNASSLACHCTGETQSCEAAHSVGKAISFVLQRGWMAKIEKREKRWRHSWKTPVCKWWRTCLQANRVIKLWGQERVLIACQISMARLVAGFSCIAVGDPEAQVKASRRRLYGDRHIDFVGHVCGCGSFRCQTEQPGISKRGSGQACNSRRDRGGSDGWRTDDITAA